jgi:hypothetical protein
MSRSFEELDFRPTPMGVLSLRRRRRPMPDVDVYEIKLGDEFLMSSQFTAAEIEQGWRPSGPRRRAIQYSREAVIEPIGPAYWISRLRGE